MGGHLLIPSLYKALRLKRLTPNLAFSKIIRRYKNEGKGSGEVQGGIDKERARTTAEEFEKVAEEKSRQGFSSQTAEKARDAAEEATFAASPHAIKEAYKESPQSGADFKRNPHSDDN